MGVVPTTTLTPVDDFATVHVPGPVERWLETQPAAPARQYVGRHRAPVAEEPEMDARAYPGGKVVSPA